MVGGSESMHTEIFNNIDLLVDMAGSTISVDDIESELIHLRKEIQDKKQEIEDLKGMMNDNRYFNASGELVDKNIEISLKSKIHRFQRKIKEFQLKLNEVKEKEKSHHQRILALKEKIEESEKYLETLESKTNSDSPLFQKIVDDENQYVQSLKNELEEKNQQYQDILKELELNEQALKEWQAKKETDEARLLEVQDNLNNPNTYLDEELKKHDEERLNQLQLALEDLQKRRLEYLTDPSMIGADAKEFVVNENYTEALNKIKELVTIVKAKPFMDISNLEVLDEELDKKEKERSELASYIDSNDYAGHHNDVILQRIDYLNQEMESEQQLILEYQKKNQEVENKIHQQLSHLIQELEESLFSLTKEIEDYRILLKDSTKSKKTKSNLESAIIKKEKEKEDLEKVLDYYKRDLLFQVTFSNTILKMNQKLSFHIEQYEQELDELKKMNTFDDYVKDFILEEKDKDKLKAINDEIKEIKNRKRFDKTPDEIYDQIEMLLANVHVEPSKVKKEVQEPVDMDIDDLFTDVVSEPRLKVVEMIPAQTIQGDVGAVGGVQHGA